MAYQHTSTSKTHPQNHSYNHESPHSKNQPQVPSTSSSTNSKSKEPGFIHAAPRRGPPSIRTPRQTSAALASLVSRFEALDTVDTPCGTSSFIPAPLCLSKTLPRTRRDTTAQPQPTQRQWSTIFSPRPASLDKFGSMLAVDDTLVSELEDRFSTPDLKGVSPAKSSGLMSKTLAMGQLLSPGKGSTGRSKEKREASLRTPLERFQGTSSPRRERKISARRSREHGLTVRDRIKLFDQAESLPSRRCSNLQHQHKHGNGTQTSFARAVPKGPVARRNSSKEPPSHFSTPATKGWTNAWEAQSVESSIGKARTHTSMAVRPLENNSIYGHGSPLKDRGLTFNQAFPNPFHHHTPHSKAPSVIISPQITPSKKLSPKSVASKNVVSPSRRGRSRYADRETRRKSRSSRGSVGIGISPERCISRSALKCQHTCQDKKSLGKQIESLYIAKSKERQHAQAPETPSRGEVPSLSSMVEKEVFENSSFTYRPQYDGPLSRKDSKVAGMKALFDGGASSKSKSHEDLPSMPKPSGARLWSPNKRETTSFVRPHPPVMAYLPIDSTASRQSSIKALEDLLLRVAPTIFADKNPGIQSTATGPASVRPVLLDKTLARSESVLLDESEPTMPAKYPRAVEPSVDLIELSLTIRESGRSREASVHNTRGVAIACKSPTTLRDITLDVVGSPMCTKHLENPMVVPQAIEELTILPKNSEKTTSLKLTNSSLTLRHPARSDNAPEETDESVPLRIEPLKITRKLAPPAPQTQSIEATRLVERPRFNRPGGIGDRIKMFESRADSVTKPELLPRIISKNIIKTGKASVIQKNDMEERDLGGKTTETFVDCVLQDMQADQASVWKCHPPPSDSSTAATLDGTLSGKRMREGFADCGLKEPKPMRLLEMKRMITLCRGKGPAPSRK